MWPSYFIIFISIFFINNLHAESKSVYQFEKEENHTVSYLSFLGHQSGLKSQEGELVASGLVMNYKHDFSKKLSIQAQLMLSLQTEATNSMTGLGLYGTYNLFRDLNDSLVKYSIDSKKILEIENSSDNYLELSLGAHQYYFNGEKGVYSLSGPSAKVSYIFEFYKISFSVGAQTTSVQINKNQTSLNSVLAGLLISL